MILGAWTLSVAGSCLPRTCVRAREPKARRKLRWVRDGAGRSGPAGKRSAVQVTRAGFDTSTSRDGAAGAAARGGS